MSVVSRSYFSIPFIAGATYFARQARGLEDGYDGSNEYFQENSTPHRAVVLAAIISAVTCLEAFINELFSDADEASVGLITALPQSAREIMAKFWDIGIPRTARHDILNKYDVAFLLITGKTLDRSRPPTQDTQSLIKLRNALIHFEPSWQQHATPVDPKLAHQFEKLFNGKFLENKLTGQGNPFYPDKLLGYGCAQWAAHTAIDFVDYFCKEIAATPPYDHIRDTLKC